MMRRVVTVFALFTLPAELACGLRRQSKAAQSGDARAVSDHTRVQDKEDSETAQPKALGLAGRVMSLWIPMLQARNVSTKLASEKIRAVDQNIARIIADLPEVPLSDSDASYCNEMDHFTREAYVSEVNNYFKKDPIAGMHESSADEVFGLFGFSSNAANVSSVREWGIEDMFDDMVSRFGPNGKKPEGFDSWTASTLNKYPGLQATTQDVLTLTKRLAEYQQTGDVVRDKMFWMIQHAVEDAVFLTSPPRSLAHPLGSFVGHKKIEKAFLVFLPIQLAAEVAAGRVKAEESNALFRAILTENIRWATSVEKTGNRLFQGGSMENVKFGADMLQKVWATCISWKYNPATVAWDMIAPMGVKDRALTLYNVWNSRFVHFFYDVGGADAMKSGRCRKFSTKWLAAPQAATHVVGSLALSVGADVEYNLWSSYRPISLTLVGVAVEQDCDGKIGWKGTF